MPGGAVADISCITAALPACCCSASRLDDAGSRRSASGLSSDRLGDRSEPCFWLSCSKVDTYHASNVSERAKCLDGWSRGLADMPYRADFADLHLPTRSGPV